MFTSATVPEFQDYIRAENGFTVLSLAPWRRLQREIAGEILEFGTREQSSSAISFGEYSYRLQHDPGARHPMLLRRKIPGQVEEVFFNPNELLQRFPSSAITLIRIAPDNSSVAFAVDLKHSGTQSLFRWHFTSQSITEISLSDVQDAQWGLDGCNIFYTTRDNMRSTRLFAWNCLSQPSSRTIFEAQTADAFLYLQRSKSGRELVLHEETAAQSRFLIVPFAGPQAATVQDIKISAATGSRLLAHPRHFVLIPRGSSPRVISRNAAATSRTLPLPANSEVDDGDVFEDALFVTGRVQMRPFLSRFNLDGWAREDLNLPQYTERVRFLPQLSLKANYARAAIESFEQPPRQVEIPVKGPMTQAISAPEGGMRREARTEVAESKDGTMIPITIVALPKTFRDGASPLLLVTYGAYGALSTRTYSEADQVLLNRGFRLAIAHIRGGGEGGSSWHRGGSRQQKLNSIADFIAAAQKLISSGHTDASSLFAYGKSAGGLTVAVGAGRNPELFRGVILDRPLVDVMAAIDDSSAPLFARERAEWGDPEIPHERTFIESYSPYHRIADYRYPAMLVISALNDKIVPCVDVVRWFAVLRRRESLNAKNLGQSLLYVSVNATHESEVDEAAQARLEAMIQAFLISQLR